jgi:hypothetical protein
LRDVFSSFIQVKEKLLKPMKPVVLTIPVFLTLPAKAQPSQQSSAVGSKSHPIRL